MTRSNLRRALLLVVILTTASAALAQRITGVETVGFTVSNMDRSVEFYSRVLQFQRTSDRVVVAPEFGQSRGLPGAKARVVRMKLGDEQIELTQYLNAEGRPVPADVRANDGSFQHVAIIVRDMDKAYAILRQNRVRHASSAPQRLPEWNKNAANITAFYFRDPDGHYLELLQFPPDKGLAKWHRPGDDLFLGIDHTAIVVADTEQALRFYRDLLGMQVAGASENYGTEQEHLNGVFGAHLQITALRADSGPGIELLEYLSPADGRSAPMDVRANDLLHWETRVKLGEDANIAYARLKSANIPLVSPKPFEEFLARDPGRHVLVFHSASN
jgi:catechol 2,3-dioxygenase-like lactoylglutathione lyase family enzyme